MAINPMIALQGQPTNVMGAIQGGLQTAQQIRQIPIQAALDRQRVQAGQQQLQMGEQGIQQNTNALQQTRGRYVNQLATALSQLPLEQRAGAVARALPQMEQMGISRQQVIGQDLSDQGLGQIIAATRPFAMQNQGASNFQFGASRVVQGEDGQMYEATQRRNPRTGEVNTVMSPIQGDLATTTGETVEQKSTREISEYMTRKGIDLNQFESEQQLRAAYAREIAREGAEGSAEVQRTLAQDLAAIENRQKRDQALNANQVARLDSAIESGLSASTQIPRIREGLEILKNVNTGGLTALSKRVTDWFGTTSGDIGTLNQIMGQNVLAGLQAFGSQITEGERAFVMEIETSMRQGKEFNNAQLERMESMLQRKIDESIKAAELAGDEYALEVIQGRMRGQGAQQPAQGEPQDIDELLNLYAPQQ